MSQSGYRNALKGVIGLMAGLVLAFVLHGTLLPARLGPRLPSATAVGDGVWLMSHGALHRFDAKGQRLQTAPLADLSLSDGISSLQFTGPDTFFTHDQGNVLRCRLSAKSCQPVVLPGLSATPDYRWVRVSADEAEIVVSDTSAHRVLVFRRAGPEAPYTMARSFDQGLRFPNQTLASDGLLWVANTNHHELTALDTAGSDAAPVAGYLIEFAGLRDGRTFPFAMQRDPTHAWWVLVAGPGMRDAQLLQLDAALNPRRVVKLEEDQDPNGVLWSGDRLLVTDATRFQVHQVSDEGRLLGRFGDATFQAELDAARTTYAWGQRLPTLLMVAIATLIVLALWLGWKAGEFRQLAGARWRNADATGDGSGGKRQTDTPPTRRNASLGPRPVGASVAALPHGSVTAVKALPGATAVRRRWLVALGLLWLGLAAIWMFYFWPGFFQRDCGPNQPCDLPRLVLWMFWTSVLTCALVYALTWRRLRQYESLRVATDGQRLAVRWGNGRVFKAPSERVTVTRQHLLVGWHTVPLRINGSPLFDEALLRRDVFDRLPRLNVLDGPMDYGWLKHMWRHAGWRGRLTVLGIAAMALLILGIQVARLMRLSGA